MSMLEYLAESEVGQVYLQENEDMILEATEYFHQTPQMIKNFIYENLEQFVIPGDLEATYENIYDFTSSAVTELLQSIGENIS